MKKKIGNEERKIENEERMRLMNNDERKRELIDAAEKVFKIFSQNLFEEKRLSTTGWQFINEIGKLNCIFCEEAIPPQIPKDKRKFKWNLSNFQRHLERQHQGLKRSQSGDANLINPSDTSYTTTVVESHQSTEQTIELQRVPATEQLCLETNDLNAASNHERVNTTDVSIPQHHENEMTASMIAKRISTEEEAKAALAELRRIAREEAEKKSELERQRKEAEEIAERIEVEENRRRLKEEQKKAVELRLLQENEEAKQREEEERQKKQQEEIARIEREEIERKASEEAEKLKVEIAEKLRKEEEREERGGTPGNTINKDGNADQMNPSSDNDLIKTGTNENIFTQQNNVINSFSNLIENQSHPTLNIQEFNAQNATNGKSDIDVTNDGNLIIESAINGNGHTDHSLGYELDSKKYSAVDNKNQEMITGQLIDFNIDFNESSTPVNFNNNSLLKSTNLVTSDSPENKEASPDAVETCDTMDLTDSREEDDSTTTARLNERKRPSDSSIANDAKRWNYDNNSQTSSVSVASTSQSNIEAQEERKSTKNIESTGIDQENGQTGLEIPLNGFTDEGYQKYLTLMRGDLQVRRTDTVYILRDIPITPDTKSPSSHPQTTPRASHICLNWKKW